MKFIFSGVIVVLISLIICLYVTIAGLKRDLTEKEIMIGEHNARILAIETNVEKVDSQLNCLYNHLKLTYNPGSWSGPKIDVN